MPDLLIRGVSDEVKQTLSRSASEQGRSLQSELRLILEQASRTIASSQTDTELLIEGSPFITTTSSQQRRHRVDTKKERMARIAQRKHALEAGKAVTARCGLLGNKIPSPLQMLDEARHERSDQIDRTLASLTFPEAKK